MVKSIIETQFIIRLDALTFKTIGCLNMAFAFEQKDIAEKIFCDYKMFYEELSFLCIEHGYVDILNRLKECFALVITEFENGTYEFDRTMLEIPKGLEVDSNFDWSRDIQIIVTKTEINAGNPENSEGSSNLEDGGSTENPDSSDEDTPKQ